MVEFFAVAAVTPSPSRNIGQLQCYFSATSGWWDCHRERLEMEQSWTVDKYDVPSGDLEFWARRRGAMPVPANQNFAAPEQPSDAKLALKRLAMVAWLAILLGLAMQGLVLAGKISAGDRPAMASVMIDLAQGVTWSFFVCAGVGLGTTIAKAHSSLGGLIGLVAAPLAMGLAKGSQKFMVGALGAAQKPAILSLTTLGVLRAVEYGLLGWALAWLATRQETRASRYLTAGAIAGLVFGGGITLLTISTAQTKGIALVTPQILATAINEIVFPIGCSVVVYVALQIGRHMKLLTSDQNPTR
jgi:hypothetical protein